MGDVDLLEGVLGKTGAVIGGVRADQWDRPTPCSDWDVRALVEHILGWMRVFAAAADGSGFEGDPGDYALPDDPAGDFAAMAAGMVEGWRRHGTDRMVRLTSGELPGTAVLDMTLMEYVTHGWDLATATEQPLPFTDAEAEDVLVRARRTLRPEYRGPGTAMGEEAPAPGGAPAIARLAAFMGRAV